MLRDGRLKSHNTVLDTIVYYSVNMQRKTIDHRTDYHNERGDSMQTYYNDCRLFPQSHCLLKSSSNAIKHETRTPEVKFEDFLILMCACVCVCVIYILIERQCATACLIYYSNFIILIIKKLYMVCIVCR